MGFFDMFRSKSPADTMQEEMKRLAPTLFPGGHEEIQKAGKSISGLLDNRIPPDASARLFASTKYLAYTAKDKSKQRVVEYIVRQGVGRISQDDAGAIYDRFIVGSTTEPEMKSPAVAPSTSDAMYIDDSLEGREYRLQNSVRAVQVSAMIFTVMLVGLRSQGWKGAAELFTPSGTAMKPLSGSYLISERDAREMSAALESLAAASGLDSETEAMVSPLISIASQGSFTVHA
jgi:hypothetical protein